MTEAKHTPGPWEYRECSPYDDGFGYISADGRDIVHAGVSDLPAEENRANGRLQAAAPDLLDALRWMLDEFDADEFGSEGQMQTCAKAREAIGKATPSQS